MSSSALYTFSGLFNPLLSHWRNQPVLAGDYDYITVNSENLEAQIRSGDYFVTLATKIEVMSQRLPDQHNDLADSLEQIASELLYLQNYYKIVKKEQ